MQKIRVPVRGCVMGDSFLQICVRPAAPMELTVFYDVYCHNVGSQDQEVGDLDMSKVFGFH